MVFELFLFKADIILIDMLLLSNLYLIYTSGLRISVTNFTAHLPQPFRILKGKANSFFFFGLQKLIAMIDISFS